MEKDAASIPVNALGKIGAVATDIADTQEEISKIKVAEYYTATPLKENRAKVYTWLRDNGFGDLVKNQVTCSFGRNEEEKASGLLSHLNEKGYQSTQREWVEPSTLRAFVREQYEVGKELPMDLLGAFIGHKTTIKSE